MNLSDAHLEGTMRTSADGNSQYFVVLNQSWNEQPAYALNYSVKNFRVDLPNSIAAGSVINVLPDPQFSFVKVSGKYTAKSKAGNYRTLIAQKDSDGNTFINDVFIPFGAHIYRVGSTAIPASGRTSAVSVAAPKSSATYLKSHESSHAAI